jgi:hypothetical protein
MIGSRASKPSTKASRLRRCARVGGAMNPVEQFRGGDRRNREVLFGVFFQLGL